MINIVSIFCEIAIRWMPQYLTDHKSTLVQVMVWCRQATSHYLSQCWLSSLSPYGVVRPQWVNDSNIIWLMISHIATIKSNMTIMAWHPYDAQCMKRPVDHSLNSTWFWIELPENCCEPLKFIMKYISIQFCERHGHGRPFHALDAMT